MALKTIAGILFSHNNKLISTWVNSKVCLSLSSKIFLSFQILLFWKIPSLLIFTYLGNNSKIFAYKYSIWKNSSSKSFHSKTYTNSNTYLRLYTKHGRKSRKGRKTNKGKNKNCLIFKNCSPQDYIKRDIIYITHQTTCNEMTWKIDKATWNVAKTSGKDILRGI